MPEISHETAKKSTKKSSPAPFDRADLARVRDACNGFLIAYIWNQGDGELNRPAVLASLRNLRREINQFVRDAGLAGGSR